MDPSRSICEIINSFNKQTIKYEIKNYENNHNLSMSPRTRRNKLIENENFDIEIPLENITIPDNIANLKISSNVFDKNDIILANIDAVYNFTGQEDGYLKSQYIKPFDFVSLDGNYIKYLQYRLPASRGFTSCSISNEKYFDIRTLNTNCDENDIADYVLDIVPEGVDLVISSKIDYKNNLLNALKSCKSGGTFVCRINEQILDLLYITTLCFETFSLFKPISENLNELYSYVIAQNYKGNSIDWVSILENEDPKLSIPQDFIMYVKDYNISLNSLKKKLLINPISYNSYKCKAIWNIF